MSEIDPDLSEFLMSQGYIFLRSMPDGSVAGISPFLFTYGLCTHLDLSGYLDRWCYESPAAAVSALCEWDGKDDPPGPWVKQKGRVQRSNPALFDIRYNPDGSEWATRKARP